MTSVKLSDDLVNKAKQYASVYSRSVPKQIEHWVKIGRIAEDNPDLPYEFIKDILIAEEEIANGEVSDFQFGPVADK